MSQTNVGDALVNGETLRFVTAPAPHRLRFRRLFTKPDCHPFEEIGGALRTAPIQNDKGDVVFEQGDVEVPKDWSQTATNIVAAKYFHARLGTAERESSVRQLISRAAGISAADTLHMCLFKSCCRAAMDALEKRGPAGLAAVGWAIVKNFVALKQKIGR